MFRSTSHLVGTLLLIGSAVAFISTALYAFPILLEMPSSAENSIADAIVPTTEATKATSTAVSAEPTSTPTTLPATPTPIIEARPLPSTNVSVQAPLQLNEEPPVPTASPTATPTAVIAGNETTAKPQRYWLRATQTAWMLASLDREERWLGWFLAPDMTAEVVGRSEDGEWLHVIHPVDGMEGWVFSKYVDVEGATVSDLSVSNYSVDVWSVRTDSELSVLYASVPRIGRDVAVNSSNGTPANDQQWAGATEVAKVWPTATKDWTASATVASDSSQSVGQWSPTATPWPTNTPWPSPTPTLSPTSAPTIGPTSTKIPLPTPTPLPTQPPTPTATAAPVLTQPPTPISQSNAVAWWQLDTSSVQTIGDGNWRFDIDVRVPTSFSYDFEMAYLIKVTRSEQNLDGDDIFRLNVWGIKCGEPLNEQLLAYQNGALMTVQNEFTLEIGRVFVNPPC